MKPNPPDDAYIMYVFLFLLRTTLSGIRSASSVIRLRKVEVPEDVRRWLEKWSPKVEEWAVAETNAHLWLDDGKFHDWKQMIFGMAENMKDVSVAYVEGQNLRAPESPEGEMIFNLALENGFGRLNMIIQPILQRDFRHLEQ